MSKNSWHIISKDASHFVHTIVCRCGAKYSFKTLDEYFYDASFEHQCINCGNDSFLKYIVFEEKSFFYIPLSYNDTVSLQYNETFKNDFLCIQALIEIPLFDSSSLPWKEERAGYIKIHNNGIIEKELIIDDSLLQTVYQNNKYSPRDFSVTLMIDIGETLEKKACEALLGMERFQFLQTRWEEIDEVYKNSDQLSNFLTFSNIDDTALFQWKLINELKELLCSNVQDFQELFLCISNDNPDDTVIDALRKSCESSIRAQNFYNPTTDFVLCKTFSDTKLLTRMILLSPERKNKLLSGLSIEDRLWFINLLKANCDENNIYRLLKESSEEDPKIWNNTIDLISLQIDKNFVKNNYHERRCDIHSINAELKKCASLKPNNDFWIHEPTLQVNCN